MSPSSEDIAQVIRELTAKRGPDKTICPSEAARALHPDSWRELMPRIRETAIKLVESGAIEITQGGEPVRDLENLRGPIRLRTL